MTTTDIIAQFERLGLDESKGMCLLADSNQISDNCVRAWDIAQADVNNAVQWLMRKRQKDVAYLHES